MMQSVLIITYCVVFHVFISMESVCKYPWPKFFQGCELAEMLGCTNVDNVKAVLQCEGVHEY